MRVIAGSAKGRRLGPVPPGARPVSDRAREGLFSSLGAAVVEARVLDLYAGTGALGIEALSRGASRAVFVDRDHAATEAIRDNLRRTGLAERATVVTAEISAFLRGGDAATGPFDLVFADPPYDLGSPVVDRVLEALAGDWLSADGWTVALTRRTGSSTPVIPIDWAVARQLRYGDSLVVLFREVGWA